MHIAFVFAIEGVIKIFLRQIPMKFNDKSLHKIELQLMATAPAKKSNRIDPIFKPVRHGFSIFASDNPLEQCAVTGLVHLISRLALEIR